MGAILVVTRIRYAVLKPTQTARRNRVVCIVCRLVLIVSAFYCVTVSLLCLSSSGCSPSLIASIELFFSMKLNIVTAYSPLRQCSRWNCRCYAVQHIWVYCKNGSRDPTHGSEKPSETKAQPQNICNTFMLLFHVAYPPVLILYQLPVST